jgi:peptidoglycan/LPS O-acetylase OafA/YrhL
MTNAADITSNNSPVDERHLLSLPSRHPLFARAFRPKSLAAFNQNNFNLIRLMAATGVIFSHSYALSGRIAAEPIARLLRIADLAGICVVVFFIVSGYLIAQSVSRRPPVLYYIAARVLRIFPGLALSTFLVVFLIGPTATELPIPTYFANALTWEYAAYNLILQTGHFLPGVFLHNPVPMGVNGSLWTVQIEVFLYLVMLVAMVSGIFRRRVTAVLFMALCMLAWLLAPDAILPVLPSNDAYMMPRLIGSFMLGVFFSVTREYVPLSRLGVLFAIACVYLVSGSITPFYYALYATIAYSTLVIAFHPRMQVDAFKKVGDYSYGLYVFAFPVQQCIVQMFGPIEPLALFASSYAVTLPIAVLSWEVVERRALRWKVGFTRR